MTRVLLCDDNAKAADAIEAMSDLRVEDGGSPILVARQARTARAALFHLSRVRAEVVLIDLFLPVTDSSGPAPASGAWLAREILREFQTRPAERPKVLLWTSNTQSTLDVRNECRAFRHHGGDHVIDKQHQPERQLRRLEAALAGERWDPPADELTDAEREVLAYYAAGFEQKEIAARLIRSDKRVEELVRQIRHKLIPADMVSPGKGAGAVLAAISTPQSTVSWVPVEHLGELPARFRGMREQG